MFDVDQCADLQIAILSKFVGLAAASSANPADAV
jgi:hypothetical protein